LDDLQRHDVNVVHFADRVLQIPEPFDENRPARRRLGDGLQQIAQSLAGYSGSVGEHLILAGLDGGKAVAERRGVSLDQGGGGLSEGASRRRISEIDPEGVNRQILGQSLGGWKKRVGDSFIERGIGLPLLLDRATE
jgi:hypothetical protein